MDYKEFFKVIKSQKLNGAYILYGAEEYIKDLAVKEIIDNYVGNGFSDINVVKLDGAYCDFGQIENACMTLPFMAQSRVVAVNDYNLFQLSQAQANKSTTIEKLKDHSKLFEDCPPETILLFVQRGNVINAITKIFDKDKRVEFKNPTGEDKQNAVAKIAERYSLKISQSNVRTLIDYTSMDLLALDSEILKLKSYVKDGEVTQQDIFDVCTAGTEYNVFSMLKLISNNNGSKAISVYRQLLLEGQSPQALISMIQRQYRALFYMDEINNSEEDYKHAAEMLNIQEFVIKNMKRLSEKISKEQRVKIARWCADADYLIKKGEISVDSSAEMLIMKLINV